MTAPCPETKYIPYRNYSDPNICLRYYVTSDFLYLLLRFLEYHIGNANGNEAQYATRRLLDVVLLFDSNEDAEDFAKYGVPVGEEIKWSDLWEISKGKYRADFLKSFTPDKLKGYYRRFFNRVVDKPSLLFIFTVTCVYTQPCYQAENEVLKFHMQEAFQRIQMDTRPDGFATMIMDELNQDKVKQLKDACHRMMVEGDFVKYENVYHGVLTECSSQSTGIQLADYAVGIMNCYLRKHLMSRGDYTFATDLYTEFVLPHLRKHANGTIVGYGVREVPSDSSIRQVLIPLFN